MLYFQNWSASATTTSLANKPRIVTILEANYSPPPKIGQFRSLPLTQFPKWTTEFELFYSWRRRKHGDFFFQIQVGATKRISKRSYSYVYRKQKQKVAATIRVKKADLNTLALSNVENEILVPEELGALKEGLISAFPSTPAQFPIRKQKQRCAARRRRQRAVLPAGLHRAQLSRQRAGRGGARGC